MAVFGTLTQDRPVGLSIRVDSEVTDRASILDTVADTVIITATVRAT